MIHKRITTFILILIGICYSQAYAQNPKPFVIPELQEWTGKTGDFVPREATRIVYGDIKLEKIAVQFAEDYSLMFGIHPEVTKGQPHAGDFFLTIRDGKSLGPESYAIDIDEYVRVSAPESVGVYWATRTLLQMSEKSENRSLPKGLIRDFPDYGVRGFMIDCGRKFIPMDYLRDLAHVMSYYKMNFLHIVLNNNGFPQYFNDDWDKTYAAFRLECDTYPGLTARDGYYTKEEFKEFQSEASEHFLEIIPEIDVPAHSLVFSQYRPSLGSKKYGMDHLDLFNPEIYPFLDALFKEYLEGNDPVFRGEKVHIGTDEYSNKDKEVVEQFRAFTDHYIKYVEGFGKKACIWGSLTHAAGVTPVKSDEVTMYAWNNGYADPKEMATQGYKLISIPDGWLYIVPQAGYYYDYLDTESLYKQWTPAKVGDVTFDENDPAIMGGMFALWNDIVGNGVSVKDIHHRIMPSMQTISVKTWNANPTVFYEEFEKNRKDFSEAPGVNQLGRIGQDNTLVYELPMLKPNFELPYPEIGYDYTVTFDMEAKEEEIGTVLFRSQNAIFYLSDPIKGMFGFARDGYLNTFNFRPYKGEKISVKITGDSVSTALYINDKLIEEMVGEKRFLNDAVKKQNTYLRTLVFPLQKSGKFNSEIKNLKIYNYKR